jgi:cytosine/adenosine deaminase-related metal-dependent hydrolase
MRLLIEPRWVVPVEPAGAVLENHAVAVRDARIEALLPSAEAATRFAGYERVTLAEHVLIPGLVNAHTHAAMSLMRGLADDLPLMRWLEQHIWPAEGKHVSPAMVRDGTLLACAEMLRGGITCFNDMYFFPEASLEAARGAGMRVALGLIVIEFPTPYASDAADYLRKGLALRDREGDDPLVSFCLAPHAPYTVSDASFRQVAKLAAELDLPVHVHLHETEEEVRKSLAEHGVRPIERMRRLGLLGPGLIAVHAVHLEKQEVELLGAHAASVAHCPSSNLKLASGGRGAAPRGRQRLPRDRRGRQQQPARSHAGDAHRRAAREGRGARRRGAAGARGAARGDARRRAGARHRRRRRLHRARQGGGSCRGGDPRARARALLRPGVAPRLCGRPRARHARLGGRRATSSRRSITA